MSNHAFNQADVLDEIIRKNKATIERYREPTWSIVEASLSDLPHEPEPLDEDEPEPSPEPQPQRQSEPEPQVDPDPGDAAFFDAYPVYDGGDVRDDVPPRQWLLGNTWCRKFASSLLADGGTGKTTLRIAQAVALCSGREITGEHVFEPGSIVLYLTLEDDRDEFERRLLSCLKYHGIAREEIKGRLFYLPINGPKLASGRKEEFMMGQLGAILTRYIDKLKPDVVILDPFIKSHACDENDNNAIDQVISILTNLAHEKNIAMDVPHHMAKGSSDPGNANKGRGASALKDGTRLTYTLSFMTTEDRTALGIEADEQWRYVRLDSAKVNIAPRAGKATWFKMVSVQLNNPDQYRPHGDNVQTMERYRPLEFSTVLCDEEMKTKILDQIGAAPEKSPYQAHPLSGNPVIKLFRNFYPTITWSYVKDILQQWKMQGLIDDEVEFTGSDRKTKKNGILLVLKGSRPFQ